LETVLIASQRILPIGACFATQSLAHAIFGLFLLNRGLGIIGLLEAFLLSQIIYLVLIRIFISDRLLSIDFDFGQIKLFLAKSWPYFIIASLALVYSRVDLVLIKHWLGESSAGYYSAAYRFLDAVNIFPAALALTQTPLFARLGREGAGGWEKYRTLLAGNMV
jgi:O-antigen/teichoic acid export membrane protein